MLGVILGGLAGLGIGLATPAHVEVAGSDTKLWLRPGRTYDELSVGRLATGKRATTRRVLGEPVGVQADVALDTTGLLGPDGAFDPDVLPAYVQAFSDPQQLVEDARRAMFGHLIGFTVGGAVAAVLLIAGSAGYRAGRRRYDRRRFPNPAQRIAARRYYELERRVVRRCVVAAVVLVTIAAVPSADRHPPARPVLRGNAALAGTPLAGTEIDGLLRPAIAAARTYIDNYFARTDAYYDALRSTLETWLADHPVALPGREDAGVQQLGFVTDRHCNIGMDRVTVALLRHFGVTTLLSGGDDAFSGTFSFEAACTKNLADKTAQAGIMDVFVGGNHDSPETIGDERTQGIQPLVGAPVTTGGLTFIGEPDPRTSRYGQGIVPSDPHAQQRLVDAQGAAVGRRACARQGPVIAVLHDPSAGRAALSNGCGRVTLALCGHVHRQEGPTPVPIRDGRTGYLFVGASSGGAPGGSAIDRSLSSRITVGPLHHDATVNIVSVERKTGALRGITAFTFTADHQIRVTQLLP